MLRAVVVLVGAFIFAGAQAGAQSFGLNAASSATSIAASNNLSYTIIVTNLSGRPLTDVLVSNVFSTPATYVSSDQLQGSFTNTGNSMVFYLGVFQAAQILQLSLTVQPVSAGLLTNQVTIANTNIIDYVPPSTTNLVTTVTNIIPPKADLAVTMSGPGLAVLVNDWMIYRVAATNLGPDSATGVLLTNTLAAGALLKGVSPKTQPYITVGNKLIFNLGTLAAGGGMALQFTVQPTNAGVLNFSSSLGSSDVMDPNRTNNVTSTNITILNYFSGPLFVTTNSAQILNLQNGLTEQSILLSNNVGTNVGAVRVIVTNSTKRLVNAVGTNAGNPFVVLNTGLPAGDTVNLLLQFAPRGNFALVNSQLQAFAVPPLDLTPPAAKSSSKLINISRIIPLASGNVFLEFPSTLGKTYTVVYSDNAGFSNAAMAQPAVVAPANQVQWIDYGPPATTSAPTNAPARFYRVFQNQ